MHTTLPIVIIAVVLIAAGIVMWAYFRNRSRQLHQRFGPEYERAVRETGGRRRAEEELEKRERRVAELHIRPVPPGDLMRFAEQWRQVQARFVDDPKRAIAGADALVGEVMSLRGYPVGEFDQRTADISVDHPHEVENYRAAHAIAVRQRREEASTEDLRRAMVHYRTLFEGLLGTDTAANGR
jgi:hypothetical protein